MASPSIMEHRSAQESPHGHMSALSRWSSPDGSCTVEIATEVVDSMLRMANEAHPLETGASLYGTYGDDQRRARIEGIAPVSVDSARGRFNFRRGVAGLAAFFRRLFVQSKGESFYVGEFHTHPGGAVRPSSQDDATQFAIASDPSCQCLAPVLVIIGGTPKSREVAVFVHTRRRRRFELIEQTGSG